VKADKWNTKEETAEKVRRTWCVAKRKRKRDSKRAPELQYKWSSLPHPVESSGSRASLHPGPFTYLYYSSTTVIQFLRNS